MIANTIRQPERATLNETPAHAERPTKTPPARYHEPFKIKPFVNTRTGSRSWRVDGFKRDRTRIRENFTELKAAECRKVELTTEWLAFETKTAIRATKMTDAQIKLAETAFIRLESDHELNLAVEYWLNHGRENAVAESPRLEEAFEQFSGWLETSPLRPLSRVNLRRRLNVFVNSIPNVRISEITPETIDAYLSKRGVSPKSKDNDRRAVSRFLGWCRERPRRWARGNPCREVKIDQGESAPPTILSLAECETLLREAEEFKDGRMVPYVAVCLFGGLRPFEASRLTWKAVNLKDREIRLEGIQTKTGDPRVVTVCDTLEAWLEAYEDTPFISPNWRRDFDAIKAKLGYGRRTKKRPDLKPWPVDVMRHTAVSYHLRLTGSYGQTAEQFGNSESIIKKHYQGRVTSEDTKRFYAILPSKKGAK